MTKVKNSILLSLLLLSSVTFSQSNEPIDCDSFKSAIKQRDKPTSLFIVDSTLIEVSDSIFLIQNLQKITFYKCYSLDLESLFNDLTKVESLRNLSINASRISSVPHNVNLLNQIIDLDFSDNTIKNFPEGVLNLQSLQKLDFFSNEINTINCSKEDLRRLEYINLCYNRFSRFPYPLSELQNIRTIRAWGNNISQIHDSIGQFKVLEELNLGINGLNKISKSIKHCNSLKVLTLQSNSLSTSDIKKLCRIPNLEKLDVKENPIKKLPKQIENLENLTDLNVSKTKITKIPNQLKNLKKLEQLGIGQLNLKDWVSTFEILSKILSLRKVGMYSMNKRTMPYGFEKLQQVDTFWLTFNMFNKDERRRIEFLVPNADITFD